MTPRRFPAAITLLLCLAAMAGAQETSRALQSYQERFRDAPPEVKLQIIQSADAVPVTELGPLYVQAVEFALSNAERLSSDVVLQKIAVVAAERLAEAGYTRAVGSLWNLFAASSDTVSRIAILTTLGELGPGNAQLVLDLNGWVQAQVNLYRGGILPDLQVLRGAVITLGELDDPSSFAVLLDTQLAQVSDDMTNVARSAMKSLSGDYVEMAAQAVNRRTISNRKPALELFLDDPDLSDEERAEIATGVLAEAVRTSTRDLTEQVALRDLRFRAAQLLIEVPYEPAADALIRHFNQTFQSYDRGIIIKAWVLESIAALGNTGSEAAAVRLTQFLDLLNSYRESDRPYDMQITLAVITNLERLGFEEAYDALFYATLLDYPQRVKDAARSAMSALTQ